MARMYAVRNGEMFEFASARELKVENEKLESVGDNVYMPISGKSAHMWVRKGYPHNTGLWLDGSRVRYAEALEV